MQTAHQIVNSFAVQHNINWTDFNSWFADAGYPEDEANSYDSRYLDHLKSYIAERDNAAYATWAGAAPGSRPTFQHPSHSAAGGRQCPSS